MPRTVRTTGAERIGTSVGALGVAFFGTVAAVFRVTSVTNVLGVITIAGTAERLGIVTSATTGLINARLGNGLVTAPTIAAAVADGWVLVAFTKPTGTSTVRFHKYVFATDTWTHENGGTNAAVNQLDGDIAAAAIWSQTQLTDAQIESLAGSFMAWWQIQPSGMWILDQDVVTQKVRDLTGGGADENARITTIVASSSCPLGYGQEMSSAW
jgi:hypothetical protein